MRACVCVVVWWWGEVGEEEEGIDGVGGGGAFDEADVHLRRRVSGAIYRGLPSQTVFYTPADRSVSQSFILLCARKRKSLPLMSVFLSFSKTSNASPFPY